MGRVKGSTLLGAVKFLRSKRAEAMPHLAPEHRHYLDETIKNSAWYPLEDLLALVGVAAACSGTGATRRSRSGRLCARACRVLRRSAARLGWSSRVFALWSTQLTRQMHRTEGRPRASSCRSSEPEPRVVPPDRRLHPRNAGPERRRGHRSEKLGCTDSDPVCPGAS
jgi:hypothetical protein